MTSPWPAPRAALLAGGLGGLLLGLGMLLSAAGCDRLFDPVRIGFCGPLTGRWADLGVQGRNGAILAVEDLNARGGVAGRRVELVVADEQDTGEATRAAVRELDGRGVAVLVGLMTSAAAVAGLPVVEAAGLTVVSPTAMTPDLTGRPDALFRVVPDLSAYARSLADYAADGDGPHSALLILDQGNAAFSEPYAQAFTERYAQVGGRVAGTLRIPPGQAPDGAGLARTAVRAGARDILAVLSARDLAKLAMEMHLVAPGLRVYTAMWGFSQEFLEIAGDAAEGVSSCVAYPFDDHSPEVAAFNARYRERFGYPPSFAAALASEAVLAAAQGLQRTRGSRHGLAEALRRIGPVPGVLGPIAFDPAGDTRRKIFWTTVRNGRMHTLRASDG